MRERKRKVMNDCYLYKQIVQLRKRKLQYVIFHANNDVARHCMVIKKKISICFDVVECLRTITWNGA
jgi:hypothetical protein